MNTSSHDTKQPSQSSFGLCLPFPRRIQLNKAREDISQKPNPFPLISDLRQPYSILPIKSYWFPVTAGETFKDVMFFGSHESVHLSLLNTPVSAQVLTLLHYQYAALVGSLSERTPIFLPSLNDSTGYLAKAQQALDLIDFPIAFVHELMATTLVHIFMENNRLFYVPGLMREMFVQLGFSDERVLEIFRRTDSSANWETILRAQYIVLHDSPFGLMEILQANLDTWLEYYSNLFDNYCKEVFSNFSPNNEPCDFRHLYNRLTNCFRAIATNLSEKEWTEFLPLLIRYPFSTLPVSQLLFPSEQASFNYLVSFVTRMSKEIIEKLKNLILIIETAPKFKQLAEWIAYLTPSLPDFNNITGIRGLNQNIKRLWLRHNSKLLADIFSDVYINETDHYLGFPALPLFVIPDLLTSSNYGFALSYRLDHTAKTGLNDLQDVPSDLALHLREAMLVTAFESVRQSIIVMRNLLAYGENLDFYGLSCLCAPEIRDKCRIRPSLKEFWQLVTPGPKYEKQFRKYWRKPTCA